MTNQNIKSLTILEILSLSWKEIKDRFLPLYIVACCMALASWLLNVYLFDFHHPLMLYYNFSILKVSCFMVLSVLAGAFFLSALVLLVCRQAQTTLQAMKMAFARFWRLLLVSFLLFFVLGLLVIVFVLLAIIMLFVDAQGAGALNMIGTSGGFLFFLFIAFVCALLVIVASIYLILLPYPLILKTDGIFASFYISFRLIKGHFWKTVGLLALQMLILIVLSIAAGIVLTLIQTIWVSILPQAYWVIDLLWVPITALFILIIQVPLITLYLDRRRSLQPAAQPANNTPSLEKAEEQ